VSTCCTPYWTLALLTAKNVARPIAGPHLHVASLRSVGRLRSNSIPLLACGVLLVVIVCGVFAPWVAPYDPLKQDFDAILKPPGAAHWMGTDQLGRDLLSRVIYGARISLLVGLISVLIRGTLGVTIGLLAGFYRGAVDDIVMRIADIQLTLPFLVVAIAVIAVVGPGLNNLILVLGFTGWVYFARVVRAEVLTLRERDFVTAARASGGSDLHLLVRHVLPNTAPLVLVIATLQIASVIIAEASLSFLGLGVAALTPTWGKIIAEARQYVGAAWWLPTFPGLVIFITVLAINLAGDSLRDHWDPRLRRTRSSGLGGKHAYST
jgi:peptide/nickel transport system permease protein